MKAEQFLEIMAVDKKNIDKRIRLILMKDLGQSFISDDYDNALLQKTIQEMLTESQRA
jgi:3-dehydroquinate synthase